LGCRQQEAGKSKGYLSKAFVFSLVFLPTKSLIIISFYPREKVKSMGGQHQPLRIPSLAHKKESSLSYSPPFMQDG
jgi:hypothetical protein